uniref:Uncharacterized protein n=1 Tax=Trichogramma kaykai TaxID=54128 RepID=A0ABD2X4I3_9HYME
MNIFSFPECLSRPPLQCQTIRSEWKKKVSRARKSEYNKTKALVAQKDHETHRHTYTYKYMRLESISAEA